MARLRYLRDHRSPTPARLRLYLLLFFLLSVLTLFAQRQQGHIWIDGATSWQTMDPADDFILDGGAFVFDGLLLGLDIRADAERLANTYLPTGGVERYELFARYYLGRTARWSPYLELGFGALSNQGSYRTLRPALGLEGRLAPGVFGRVALGYEYTDDYQVYTLEVGSSVGFNDWSDKDRIPSLLRGGQWLINSHLASVSMLSDTISPDGIYGSARINVGYLLRDNLLLDMDVRAVRQSLPNIQAEPDRRARYTATADVGLQLLPLRRSNFINPYLGVGGTYGYTVEESLRTEAVDLPQQDTSGVSPYAVAGTYIHISDRITVRADVRWYATQSYSPLESPWQFMLGTMFRFGRLPLRSRP